MTLELDTFKKKLLAEKAKLEAELSGISVHPDPKKPNDWEATYEAPTDIETTHAPDIDPMDVAETIGNYEKGFALNKELEQRLGLVTHALEKVAAGTYGKCDTCQSMIPLARLEANPAAATCISHSK